MAFARLTDLRHNFSQTTFASYQHPLTQEKCNFGILEIMQPKRHFSKTVKITFQKRVKDAGMIKSGLRKICRKQ